ncbi:MAG: hypothetical protein WCC12_02145, partial [Anaerolineales bacterium]
WSSTSQEDLSWLDQLGGAQPEQSSSVFDEKPSAPQEDLSWLNQFAAETQEPGPSEPTASKPAGEDLSWLNDLGATSEPAHFETAQNQPVSSQEDLSWLSDLGGEQQPSSAAPFADFEPVKDLPPRQTAPLGDLFHEEVPDWLKSATEASSKPADNEMAPDWFQGTAQPAEEKTPPAAAPLSAPFEVDIFPTSA